MMTQGTKIQTIEPILGTAILGTNQLQPVECEGAAYRVVLVYRVIYLGSCLLI